MNFLKNVQSGIVIPAAASFASLFVLGVWAWTYLSLSDEKDRGTFGDMFGGANAAFSGLAFVGVVTAIMLQRKEIGIARTELNRSKVLVERQQEQIETQRRDAHENAFEARFFRLLGLLGELVSAMDLNPRGAFGSVGATTGKDVFRVLVRRLAEGGGVPDYDEFFLENGDEISHYYRLFYNILSYVDSANAVDSDFYTKILRAQMSNSEVQLLFHNCFSRHGKEKLKPLVEKYTLLKHFRPTDAIAFEIAHYGDFHPRTFSVNEERPAWAMATPVDLGP